MQKFKDFIYYNRKELFIIIVFLSLFGIYIYYDNKDSSDDIVLEDISKDEITEKEENNYLEKEVTIMVDVKGEVNKPGAYTFSLGKRVIDAIKEDAYKNTILKNRQMNGEFDNIRLQPGENTITWIGDLTKIEVEAKSRWL